VTAVNKHSSQKINIIFDPAVEEVRKRGYILTQRFDNAPEQLFEQMRQAAKSHPEKMVDQLQTTVTL